MSTIKNVAVFGASGNLGPAILTALSEAGFTVSALTRPDSGKTFPSHINTVITDYTPASLHQALRNQDAVVCSVGFLAIPQQIAIADAAINAGVQRFIPSEFGVNPDAPCVPEYGALFIPKKKVLDHVKALAASSDGSFAWTAVANGPFIDWNLASSPDFGFDIKDGKAITYDSGDELFTATTVANVGRAIAGILVKTEETRDRWVTIRSLQTTQNELLRAFERQGVKFDVTRKHTPELYAQAKELLAQKDFVRARPGLLATHMFADGGNRGITATDTGDSELLGLSEVGVDELVREVVEKVGRS